MSEIKQIEPKDSLPSDLEDLIEEAYWEMNARLDPSQPQYPNSGPRYAFKQAVRSIFYKRRRDALLEGEDE